MSTLEIVIWGILWILISIEVAGCGYLILSAQTVHAESERLVAEFDAQGDR
ncbi:hypothetical protein JRF84_08250 [Methylobacterium organophilum]|uniref:hypothetical protein n=1 Tax=Methylobacterium TaxID=407 RepID=UPI0019D30649|nr:hypothetical protein [Methylobacterium organophilum]MBN6819580.1 hypothetical protein [Methylobacterium organophilum]